MREQVEEIKLGRTRMRTLVNIIARGAINAYKGASP